jgi:hypothetical protein
LPTSRTDTRAPSITTSTDFLLYLLIGGTAVAVGGSWLAWLFGNTANALIGSGPWTAHQPSAAVLRPSELWPDLPPAVLVTACYIMPATVLLITAVTGVKVWLRHRRSGDELAGPQELAARPPEHRRLPELLAAAEADRPTENSHF